MKGRLQTLGDSVHTLVCHHAESQGLAADAESQSPTLATSVGLELPALTRQVQDIYISITRNSSHKLHKDHAGVRREEQTTLNVISRSDRLIETSLKIIQSSSDPDSEDTLP